MVSFSFKPPLLLGGVKKIGVIPIPYLFYFRRHFYPFIPGPNCYKSRKNNANLTLGFWKKVINKFLSKFRENSLHFFLKPSLK